MHSQRDRLAVVALNFRVDVAVVNHLFFIPREGERNIERSWPFWAATSAAARAFTFTMEMVHDDVGVVFLASLLGEDRVEPLLVISGNEMAPLDDFQSFLAAPTPFLERGKWGRVPPVRWRRLPSRNPCERFHDSFF